MKIKFILVALFFGINLGIQFKSQALDKQQLLSRIGLISGSCATFLCLQNRPKSFDKTTKLYQQNKQWCDAYDRSRKNWFLAKLFLTLTVTGISFKYLK